MSEALCSCGHLYKVHHGDKSKQWCEGAGSQTIWLWMEAEAKFNSEAEFQQMICPCTEYDGPIPDETIRELFRSGNWTLKPRLFTMREIVSLDNPHGTGWELVEANYLPATHGDYRRYNLRAYAIWKSKEGYEAYYFWHPDTGWELGAN